MECYPLTSDIDALTVLFEYCEKATRNKLKKISSVYSSANLRAKVYHQVKRKLSGMHRCNKRWKINNVKLDCYIDYSKIGRSRKDTYDGKENTINDLKEYFELNPQIKQFEFDGDFNTEITRDIFPQDMTHLTFERWFDKKIIKNTLPCSLTHLIIDSCWISFINYLMDNNWARTNNWENFIEQDALPHSLTYLKIGNNIYEGDSLQNYINNSKNFIQTE